MDKFNKLYNQINEDKTADKKRRKTDGRKKQLNENIKAASEEQQQKLLEAMKEIGQEIHDVFWLIEHPDELIRELDITDEDIQDEIHDAIDELTNPVSDVVEKFDDIDRGFKYLLGKKHRSPTRR